MSWEVTNPERSREILGLGYAGAVRFGELLAEHGEERGLIGPRELERLWPRHVLNSAAVAPFLPQSGSVADVGSGAGLPGMVLALIRPDLEFHLIEPMERRVAWLTGVVDELDLDNVTLHQVRAEELHGRVSFEAVTARAVAVMKKLVPITMPLVAPGGSLIAQKGGRAAAEVADARKVLRSHGGGQTQVHEVDLLGDGEVTRIVQVRAEKA
ncbi:16S rRNA (guanine(527)-N(7))-methyltransferase RsmG [Pseudactinotalea sp. Z1739]|uniref:16S rRNA (guanine(527)-N(7))-methyltransferase RsmG n=1 Tax=Pseudactinotalea sp. Z1739 TaxID=3413028 RepID=UPI003C7EB59A